MQTQESSSSLLCQLKLAQLREATPEYLELLDWQHMLYALQSANARLKELTGRDWSSMQPAIDIAARYSNEKIRKALINTPELNNSKGSRS